jgi:protein-L-isoaspartate O-methyltransferase
VTKPPISSGDRPWFEYDEAIQQEWWAKFRCYPEQRFYQAVKNWSKFVVPEAATAGVVSPIDGVSVTRNEAKDGIEIVFPGKPEEDTRSTLRLHGFRSAKRDGQWYWYARFSGIRWVFAQSLATGGVPGIADAVLSDSINQPKLGDLVKSPTAIGVIKGSPLAAVKLGNQATADKLRKVAESFQKRIDFCFADRLTNTHKRAREAEHFRKEGAGLRLCQNLALKLAEKHEDGSIPGFLSGISTKVQLEWLTPKARFFNLGRADVERMGGESHHAWLSEHSGRVFQGENWAAERKWMAAIGITDAAQLDKVLGELMALIGGESEADKKARQLAELERGLEFAKITSFFQTPPDVVARMIDHACLEPGQLVLEPSAGNGCIADAITEIEGVTLHCCEINHRLRGILQHKGYDVVSDEFMEYAANTREEYDRVVMNPPFEDEQDIQHVMVAFMLLKPRGILVAIVGEGAFFREKGEGPEFREFLKRVCIHEEKLPSGTFEMTGVASRLIVLENSEVLS